MRVMIASLSEYIARLVNQYAEWSGLMATPHTGNSLDAIEQTGAAWCADNGFFSNPDDDAFRAFCKRISGRKRLQWVCVPDVVGDCRLTRLSWDKWYGELYAMHLPLAYVLQDGQQIHNCPEARCYFIGGSTQYKLGEDCNRLVKALKARGALIHMGRVNSLKRMAYAQSIGCDSVDGTSVCMFSRAHCERFIKWARYLSQLGQLNLE